MMLCRRYSSFSFVLAALLSAVCLAQSPTSAQPAGQCTPAGTPSSWQNHAQPLHSPELLPNGKVTLRFCAPDATSVRVLGDWNTKSPTGDPLTKDARGVWSITVGPMRPDLYTYWFLADGVKTIDPSNVHSAMDAARIVSYFIIAKPGTDSALYENKDVPHGEVTSIWYSSKFVASPRRALVYTPPGYRNGTERYPVLYLLHGWGEMRLSGPSLDDWHRSWTICSLLRRFYP